MDRILYLNGVQTTVMEGFVGSRQLLELQLNSLNFDDPSAMFSRAESDFVAVLSKDERAQFTKCDSGSALLEEIRLLYPQEASPRYTIRVLTDSCRHDLISVAG
jgi:hypothetical protein